MKDNIDLRNAEYDLLKLVEKIPLEKWKKTDSGNFSFRLKNDTVHVSCYKSGSRYLLAINDMVQENYSSMLLYSKLYDYFNQLQLDETLSKIDKISKELTEELNSY